MFFREFKYLSGMYLTFKEAFDLPVEEVYAYFESPEDWTRLFGTDGAKLHRGGWVSVPLKGFPIPLKAKNVENQRNKKVRWIFSGFWMGVGEVVFTETPSGTLVEGFEQVTPHGLWAAASFVESAVMEKAFKKIWRDSWKRIRKKKS